MADFKLNIQVELDEIKKTLNVLPDKHLIEDLSDLELAGAGAMLHNFYNGVENIIKQLFYVKKIPSLTVYLGIRSCLS